MEGAGCSPAPQAPAAIKVILTKEHMKELSGTKRLRASVKTKGNPQGGFVTRLVQAINVRHGKFMSASAINDDEIQIISIPELEDDNQFSWKTICRSNSVSLIQNRKEIEENDEEVLDMRYLAACQDIKFREWEDDKGFIHHE